MWVEAPERQGLTVSLWETQQKKQVQHLRFIQEVAS